MTDQEIKIAIGEALGKCIFKGTGFLEQRDGTLSEFCVKCGDPFGYHELPDYPNDLNAMREAWRLRFVTVEELKNYEAHLRYIVRRDGYMEATIELLDAAVIFATAYQHSETFCRATGIWKD